jgi:hypothetical protein
VIDKRAMAGDNAKIDALAADYVVKFPSLVITEVDQATFDATALVPPPTADQIAWAAFKATTPTALQGIVYLAKFLNLE